MNYTAGTNPILTVQIVDDTGLPVAGLVAATFPTLSYSFASNTASVAFPSLTDLAALTTAYSAGGVKERENGFYRVDGPTGLVATAGSVAKVEGEATGKHVIHPWIDVVAGAAGYVAHDFAQVLPTSPVANSVGEALVLCDILGGRFNTAQAGASTAITLDASASSTAGSYVGDSIFLIGGTGGGVRGVGQHRTVVAYNTSTKVATVDRAWSTNPDATTIFWILNKAKADVFIWEGTVIPATNTAGTPDSNTKQLGGQTVTANGAVTFQNAVVASQADVATNSVGSSPNNATMTAFTLTTGTVTSGTYLNTATLDGVYHSIASVAGALDVFYDCTLTRAGSSPTTFSFEGYLVGAINSLKVYAYNWGTSAWDQIGVLQGMSGTIVLPSEFEYADIHISNTLVVRTRFAATGLTAAILNSDRLLTGYSVILTPPPNWSSMAIDGSGRIDLGTWIGVAPLALSSQQVQSVVPSSTVVASVTGAVGSLTTNNDKTGYSLAASQHVIVDSGTVTTVTNQLTAAQIATGVWQDSTAVDFTVASSIGKSLYVANVAPGGAGGIAIVGSAMTLAASQHVIVDSGTVTTVTNQLTVAQIATGIFQDITAGDFTVANSIGKSLYTSGNAPGAASGIALVGSNVGQATSVSGNVGGVSGVTFPAMVASPTNITAGTITNVTNLTNAPTVGDFTSTMKSSITAAVPTSASIVTAMWTDLLSSSDFSTVASIGRLLKDSIDAMISSRMATYTQPTGFLAANFPAGTIANTTNVTAGTITNATNVTNLTNAPTAGDFTATMKTSITSSVPTSAAIVTALWTDLLSSSDFSTAASIGKLLKDDIDATISSRLASGSYTAPDNTNIANAASSAAMAVTQTTSAAIRTDVGLGSANLDTQLNAIYTVAGLVESQTDKLQFDVSNYVKSDPQTLANSGDFSATQKTAITTAATAATPTAAGVSSAINTNPNSTETAIKAVTDQMRFTIPNQIDANALSGGSGPSAATIAAAVRDVNNQTPTSNSLGAAVNSAVSNASTAATNASSAATAANTAANTAATAVSQTTPSAIRADIGMSTNNLDSQLTGILAAVVASSGTGGDVVTVTVTDGTNPIQNATVYFTINLSKYSAKTNSSGVCQLAPNEGTGTYGVAIFAAGYQFTPTTLNVTGTMSQSYMMTPIVITPSVSPLVTGYFYCVDNMEQPVAGVLHVLKMQSAPPGESGFSREKLQRLPIASDSTGLVEFVDLVPGATYVVTSPIIEQITFTAQSSTFQIPSN